MHSNTNNRILTATFVGAFLGFGICAIPSLADDTITLDLPSSKVVEQTAVAESNSVKSEFMQYSERRAVKVPQNQSGSNKRFASRGKQNSSQDREVGRLGVTHHKAAIYAGRSSSKSLLARVTPGTYIALTVDVGDWYGVLMSDQSTGWIHKSDVGILDYSVSAPAGTDFGAPSTLPGFDELNLPQNQRRLIQTAFSYMGVPYRWGGTQPTGLDCSGFVQRCFRSLGIGLPRTAHEQINVGVPVRQDQLQPTDRVYFANGGGYVSHTGIYLGNGYFIHSSSSNKGVAVSRLTEGMYARMYAGGRR